MYLEYRRPTLGTIYAIILQVFLALVVINAAYIVLRFLFSAFKMHLVKKGYYRAPLGDAYERLLRRNRGNGHGV
jgi:hypothetical protein